MSTEIRVPTLGESVTEATVGEWFKKTGETVLVDEPLVELETDKVTVEVPAPAAGVLGEISVNEGDTVEVGALLAAISDGTAEVPAPKGEAPPPPAAKKSQPMGEAPPPPALTVAVKSAAVETRSEPKTEMPLPPAAKKIVVEKALDPSQISGSGKRGQVLKGDVLDSLESGSIPIPPRPTEAKQAPSKKDPAPAADLRVPEVPVSDAPREERVRMTRLRQTIANRLKEAQNVAAMLSTFNEVDMTNVMGLRNKYKELFEKKHGVKLGFMSFFIKSAIQALKEVPSVNAEIDDNELVYKNYYHIGVAVGTERGLVVPVLRDADMMSLSTIEKSINGYAVKAREGKLSIEEMQGGTFTISNGGVYGSLMSTPILNAPQSGILGMHKIQMRPMVINGEIKARPMMYLALTYDHRIIDGKEAVTFLVRMKEILEDPQRMVLDL